MDLALSYRMGRARPPPGRPLPVVMRWSRIGVAVDAGGEGENPVGGDK